MTTPTQILPNLRFPEFENDGEWKVVKLGDIAQFFKGKGISKAEVSNTGTTPCIRYGELYTYYKEVVRDIKSYTNIPTDNLVLSKANDVIIPSSGETKEDISTASCIIEDGIALGGDINIIRSSANGIFLSYYLNNAKKNDIAKIAQGISIIHLYNEQLQNLSIAFPPLPEQQKIAAFLTSLDEQISAHTKKLEALKAHKKGLMQQLFPANGEKTPKLRLPEFKNEREWEEVRLGELGDTFPGLSGKDKNDFGHGKAEYITYMNVFSNPIAKKELNQNIEIDTKQHSVQYGDFFFTTSSETPQEVGMSSVWLDNKDNVYLNSFCFGYRLNKLHNFNLIFLSYFFRSYYFRKKMVVLAQGISRYNISKIKVMELPLAFPSLPEQQKIASFLTSIDEMIQAQNDKIRKLKTYKNGLMQQMFPQNK